MTNTPRFITLVGSIIVIGIAAATGCSDDTTDGGSAGKGTSGSSTTGGGAGTGTTGGSGGSGTSGGSAGTATSGGSAGTGTSGGSGGSDASGGSGGSDASGGSGGSAGGGTCPAPTEVDDGDPCSFSGTCPAACGIEELGTRSCTCATTADCDSCMAPDATMYPITMPATACSDIEDTIRDMPCDTEGAACIFVVDNAPTNRGCVCWEFATPGMTTWTCGSHNNWFAM